MRKPATDSLLNRIKRDAKKNTSTDKTYMQALNELSVEAGYNDWHDIARSNGERKINEIEPIPLDPVLPRYFDNTPNEDRPKAQLDKFWRKPFVLSRDDGAFDVRCLDGGAWDRSTFYGVEDTLEAARQLAVRKLDSWIEMMARPVVCMRGKDDLVDLMQFDHRPDGEPTLYASGITVAEAQRLLAEFDRKAAAQRKPAP